MAKLTAKQQRFVEEYLIDLYNVNCFKIWNYKYLEEPESVIIDALAILLGTYAVFRKQAALLLLKAMVRKEFLDFLLNASPELFPIDREDRRVAKWRKEILKRGMCEECGSTERLEAHHIIKWADYPQGRTDIENGRCLCHKCHTNEHKNDQCYWMMKSH